MPRKAGEHWGKFEHRGVTYSYVSCLVDDAEGNLENRVRIREYGDTSGKGWTYQDCASTAVILSWFKAMMDEAREMLDEQAETVEVEVEPVAGVCSYCGHPFTDDDAHYHKDGLCETQATD